MKTGNLWQRWWHGVRISRSSHLWQMHVPAELDRTVMSARLTDQLHSKQGRSTARWVVNARNEALSVFLKRHYQLPILDRVKAMLRPREGQSPGLIEWNNLQWATKHGIPVAVPVAAGEFIGPGLKLQSFLAVKELSGMLPLHEAIPAARLSLTNRQFAHWKNQVTREMARITRKLHQAGRFHKDLYLCHFFTPIPVEMQSRPRIHLIDFHRLARHYSLAGLYYRIKDLAQLYYSSAVEGVAARDRARFVKYYFDQEKSHLKSRFVMWFANLKGERYAAHNRKHKG